MDVKGHSAVVTGGASGLGAATARSLAERGVKVALLDQNAALAEAVAKEFGGVAVGCDVADEQSMIDAYAAAAVVNGPARILINCAGIATAQRTVGREGPHDLETFKRIVTVNLIGTFNATRLFAEAATQLDPLEDGERGVVVMTASVAAFDGQIGQAAYSASKGGVAGMTLPIARDLSSRGVRVCSIAPGIILTPLMDVLSEEVQNSLAASVPFPQRLGKAEEYAALALHICENGYLNAETIRLDGAIRMAPR